MRTTTTMGWKDIANAIRTAIENGELKPRDRIPSETALAGQWNVSRMTAHRALCVLRDQGLLVRQPRSGTFVADRVRKRVGLIALVLPSGHSALEMKYMCGVRAALSDNYHLLFCNTQGDPRQEAQYLKQMCQEADAIICLPTCAPENAELYHQVKQERTPVVFLDCVPEGSGFDAVITDNYGASRQALQLLVNKGHRRIAHFTVCDLHTSSGLERLKAHQDILQEIGEPNPSSLVRFLPPFPEGPSLLSLQIMHDALCALRHIPQPITAVFCLHEYYMYSLLDVCDRMGLRIPEDLEVVSFDDHPPVVLRYQRDVHRIVQRCIQIGEEAARRLHRRLSGEEVTAEIIRIPADIYPYNRRLGLDILPAK